LSFLKMYMLFIIYSIAKCRNIVRWYCGS